MTDNLPILRQADAREWLVFCEGHQLLRPDKVAILLDFLLPPGSPRFSKSWKVRNRDKAIEVCLRLIQENPEQYLAFQTKRRLTGE